MIDWARVTELRDEIGQDDLDEVVALFLDEVEEGIETLRRGLAAGALEEHLHYLKGSALNLGFAEFSELCQSGETAAAQGAAATIDLPRIVQCYETSKAEFLAALDSLSAA